MFPSFENKYRLELRWRKVIYRNRDVGLSQAYFYGPVLQIASKINCNDYILLDTTHQHSIFASSFYLSKLSWKNVKYVDGRIYIEDAILEFNHVGILPKINNNDYYVINCEKHEEKYHPNNLTYESYLVNEFGEVYKL